MPSNITRREGIQLHKTRLKIGILTYHRSPNFGSAMQAYCMHNILARKLPEATVELIDLRASTREQIQWRGYIKRVARRPWRLFSDYLPICRNVVSRSVSLSSPVYERTSCDSIPFIQAMGYDAVVVGSDTVWEINERPGKLRAPNPFFLPGLTGIKKLAVAVSADQSQGVAIEEHPRRAEICRAVDEFDMVAVRDQFTREFLNRLGSRASSEGNVRECVDPTLLADWTGERSRSPLDSSYLGHAVLDKGVRKRVEVIAKNLGWRSLSLYDQVQRDWLSIRKRPESSVPGFLGSFRYAKMVISDRFHGSIFGLLLRDGPVIFIERSNRYGRELSKGRDLFRKLGIERFVLRDDHQGDWEDFFRQSYVEWFRSDADALVAARLVQLRAEGEAFLHELRSCVLSGR